MNDLVQDNPAARRFEILIDESLAGVAEYELRDETVVFLHTRVEPQFREMGVGSRLVRGALDQVRARGGRVAAHCSYVAGYIKRHPEYADLLEA